MAESLTLEFKVHEDGDITVGALLRAGPSVRWAEVAHLREPLSPNGAARASSALVRAWFSPERRLDAEKAFAATFHAVTQPF